MLVFTDTLVNNAERVMLILLLIQIVVLTAFVALALVKSISLKNISCSVIGAVILSALIICIISMSTLIGKTPKKISTYEMVGKGVETYSEIAEQYDIVEMQNGTVIVRDK